MTLIDLEFKSYEVLLGGLTVLLFGLLSPRFGLGLIKCCRGYGLYLRDRLINIVGSGTFIVKIFCL